MSDLGLLTVDWDEWIESQKNFVEARDKDPQVQRSGNIHVQETDIFSLSQTQLDEYLDWYEGTWVEEDRSNNDPGQDVLVQMKSLFPIGRPSKSAIPHTSREDLDTTEQDAVVQKLTLNQAHLKLRTIAPYTKAVSDWEKEPRRIGSHYKRYKHVKDLPATAKVFFEAAAEYACIPLEYLVRAVYSIEVALISKRTKDKKNGLVGDEEESSSENEMEDEIESDLEDDADEGLTADEGNHSGDDVDSE